MIRSRTRRPAAAPNAMREPDPTRLERLATHRHKQPQDTELGCRAFAAADLLEAGALTRAYPRARTAVDRFDPALRGPATRRRQPPPLRPEKPQPLGGKLGLFRVRAPAVPWEALATRPIPLRTRHVSGEAAR